MRVVTSSTYLNTAEGKRVSLTYSEIDDNGNIIKDNQRVNKVVLSEDALYHLGELRKYEQAIVEGE